MSTTEPIILLLSGPNLELLGEREPAIYGSTTLDELIESATEQARSLNMVLEHRQSNHEGELVEAIHGARGSAAGIVINAGAFTHYSWAIRDALASFEGPVIELHLSNPGAREDFRHVSVVTPVATAVIAGLGPSGYRLAIRAMEGLLDTII